jgi:hypothetical protein
MTVNMAMPRLSAMIAKDGDLGRLDRVLLQADIASLHGPDEDAAPVVGISRQRAVACHHKRTRTHESLVRLSKSLVIPRLSGHQGDLH